MNDDAAPKPFVAWVAVPLCSILYVFAVSPYQSPSTCTNTEYENRAPELITVLAFCGTNNAPTSPREKFKYVSPPVAITEFTAKAETLRPYPPNIIELEIAAATVSPDGSPTWCAVPFGHCVQCKVKVVFGRVDLRPGRENLLIVKRYSFIGRMGSCARTTAAGAPLQGLDI